MPEIQEKGRRWSGFVCPDCRFVFRVPRDHDGKGIVCPSCRRVLLIPGPNDVPSALLAPIKKAGNLEVGDDSPRTKKQKRMRRGGAGGPNWDRAKPQRMGQDHYSMSKMLIGSGVLFLLIVVGVIFALRNREGPPSGPLVIAPAQNSAMVVKPPSLSERDQTEVAAACEPLARKFLDATTIEEVLPLVYKPEVAEARLRGQYPTGVIVPLGLSGFDSGQAMQVLGRTVAFVLRTREFEQRSMVFVDDGSNGMKIHWESFVGWSEMSWEDFVREKPSTPKMFRVLLSAVDYYNFEFRDDLKWQSYSLQSPDSSQVLYGYAERESVLNSRILLSPDVKIEALMLSLKFPENARNGSQVLIVEHLADGWVEPIEEP